ncbi:MAG: heme-binding protein [Gemmatimonadales bacterium]
MTRSTLIAMTALLAGAPLAAQQVASRPSLTMAGARTVADAVVAEAHRLGTTGVVAVVDDGGNLMYLARIDGTFAAGALVSYGKARTAALFKKPTAFFETLIKNGRTPMIALDDFTPLQGGVPLESSGQIVGAVGVSGAASAAQDEELAMAGARSLGAMTGALAPVQVFPRTEVENSFAKGGVLIGDEAHQSYQVHTSKRDKPGLAEVHTTDTDVFYVLSGAATLVTGGTVVGSRETGPNEFRGDRIDGGAERRIARGDVVVIPAGTPHWFKAVDGPVTYYTVKTR